MVSPKVCRLVRFSGSFLSGKSSVASHKTTSSGLTVCSRSVEIVLYTLFILGGKVYEGYRGAGAEAGHMVIVAGGIPCGCGRRGCFEQYASASALIRDTKKAMFENKSSVMWDLCGGDPENADGKTAFAAAKAGDEAGQTVVKNYIMYLGEGILNLINIFRPQSIIIGGGVCNEGEYLLAPLRKYVEERLYVGTDRVPFTISRAKLGNDAGIYGALALAMEK